MSNKQERKGSDQSINSVGSQKSNPRGRGRQDYTDNKEKIMFPHLFFIPRQYLEQLKEEDQILMGLGVKGEQLEDEECKAYFDQFLYIPGVKGRVINISDQQRSQVMNDGLDMIVERMRNISNKIKEKSFNILMLVPESLVSVLIGNRGQMIRKLASETKAEIVVNQPVYNMKHRTVKITGKHYYVSKCMRHINRLMLEKQAEIDFRPKLIKTVDVKTEQITSRFIFPKKLVEYLGNNHGKFVEIVKMKYNVMIKFYDDHELHYLLKRDQLVCQVQGKLQQVQEMMVFKFFEAIEDFYKKNKLDYLDVDVKILIPFKFITKIIGANGCMIKEIAQKSHGANIKALSDKFSHKQKETALSIMGSIASKKDSKYSEMVDQCLTVEFILIATQLNSLRILFRWRRYQVEMHRQPASNRWTINKSSRKDQGMEIEQYLKEIDQGIAIDQEKMKMKDKKTGIMIGKEKEKEKGKGKGKEKEKEKKKEKEKGKRIEKGIEKGKGREKGEEREKGRKKEIEKGEQEIELKEKQIITEAEAEVEVEVEAEVEAEVKDIGIEPLVEVIVQGNNQEDNMIVILVMRYTKELTIKVNIDNILKAKTGFSTRVDVIDNCHQEEKSESSQNNQLMLPFFIPLAIYNDEKLKDFQQQIDDSFTIINSGDDVRDSYGVIKGYLFTANGTKTQNQQFIRLIEQEYIARNNN